MTKSYVGMLHCAICREPDSIVLDRRMRDTFEKDVYDPAHVCDACRKKYLHGGVLVINPETMWCIVLRDDAFKRKFNVSIPNGRIVFMDEMVEQNLKNDIQKLGDKHGTA